MFWRIVRTRGVIPVVLILAALAYWRLHPRIPKTIEVGYVGDRAVTLWNTLAQVRQPIADLHYGDRVEVLTGLSPDDQVIVDPSDSLIAGMAVRLAVGTSIETR